MHYPKLARATLHTEEAVVYKHQVRIPRQKQNLIDDSGTQSTGCVAQAKLRIPETTAGRTHVRNPELRFECGLGGDSLSGTVCAGCS